MAQLDMTPEEVQFHSKGLVEDVKSMAELLRQLEAAVQDLDQSWTSNEKEVYKAAVYKDIEELKKVLVSVHSFGTTANGIANGRIERENAAASSMSSFM